VVVLFVVVLFVVVLSVVVLRVVVFSTVVLFVVVLSRRPLTPGNRIRMVGHIFVLLFFPRVARRGAQIDCMRWAIFPLEGSFPALSVSAISGVAVLLGPSAVLMLDAASGAVPVPVLARGWCAGLSFVEAPRGFRAAGAVAASDGSEAALPTSSP
jgi:hypothetical protein